MNSTFESGLLDYGESIWLNKYYQSYKDLSDETKRLAESKYLLAIEYRTFEKDVLSNLGRNGKARDMFKNKNLRWDEKITPVRSLMFREDSLKHNKKRLTK